MFQIYLITNAVNEKVYVGQTSRGLPRRWQTHRNACQKGNRTRLYYSMRHHGYECFSMSLLAEVPTRAEADQLEKLWILTLGSTDPKVGYNMTFGGDGGSTTHGRTHRPESIEKMRASALGRVMTKETKQKLSERNHDRIGDCAYRFNHEVKTSEVVSLYGQGMSTREIAHKFGMEKTAVLGRLKQEGVSLRLSHREARTARLIKEGKQHLLAIDNKLLARLYVDGRTMEEIGQQFDLTRLAVRGRLVKEGVTFRPGGKRR